MDADEFWLLYSVWGWHSCLVNMAIRVRMIVWKSDSPIVDSIGQNNRPMR